METDELPYNAFYLLLRNEYKKKHDHAVSKCWTICVPCGDSLRGVPITKEFVDDHVLRPLGGSGLRFASTDEAESHVYEIVNKTVELTNGADNNNDCHGDDEYRVNILSTEKGYNKEFQLYNIIIVDKPIHRKYGISQALQSDKLKLNRNITSYKDALEFLKELPKDRACSLDDLVTEIEKMEMNSNSSVEAIKERLHKLFRDYWASTIRKQSLDVQRDARFQKLLSLALEMFVMHLVHEGLYKLLSNAFEKEDAALKEKIDELIALGITPDQLGVREALAIPLPSAMVELATLGDHKGPLEKLMCLKGTLDFVAAEIKSALAFVESKIDSLNDNEDKLCPSTLDTDDLIPLLLFIMIKCHCQRLYTDLYYLENFRWYVSPHDDLSYTLTTFKSAIMMLESIDPNDLPPRSDRVKTVLEPNEYLSIASIKEIKTPLDKHMHDLAKSLEECTRT